ncbi:MAG: hypothetical protein GY805_26755 [Chloroflexi bacterium]|nr:hypothetical protein [Chloroflexota bacterium]
MADHNHKQQLEDLLHTINHDLRTPLSNIRSAVSILLQDTSDPLTDDQQTFINIIEHSTICLLDQSNRLLLFNQIAFATFQLVPTSLSEILANTQRILTNSYGIGSVTLMTDGNPMLNCEEYTLATTLALLTAGDTKYRSELQPSQTPAITTQTYSNKLCFTIHSLVPINESSQNLIELSSNIVQKHGGKLEIFESHEQRQVKFCLPLWKNE